MPGGEEADRGQAGSKRKLTEEEVRGLFSNKSSKGGSSETADKDDFRSAPDQDPEEEEEVIDVDGALDDAAEAPASSGGSVYQGATVNIGGVSINPWGMGTLPLSVAYPDPNKRPKQDAAISIIQGALDAGCQFFDTADTYCPDPPQGFHYCEKLLRRAIE
jgi:hypothetical protein